MQDTMNSKLPLVLIAEDETDLADLYSTWLSEEYRVRTANGGAEALERLDEDVEVVLLDRRMPDISGDEVLEELRERGIDCRVVMVTAVEPDFDIVEMGFDDYLVKPVSRDALRETVSNLLLRSEYDSGVQKLFALSSKKALLEAEKSAIDLEDNEDYRELEAQIGELRTDLDRTLESVSEGTGLTALYRDFGRSDDEHDL